MTILIWTHRNVAIKQIKSMTRLSLFDFYCCLFIWIWVINSLEMGIRLASNSMLIQDDWAHGGLNCIRLHTVFGMHVFRKNQFAIEFIFATDLFLFCVFNWHAKSNEKKSQTYANTWSDNSKLRTTTILTKGADGL